MQRVTCRGCGEFIGSSSSRCWRCGRPVADALPAKAPGLGMLAQASVITAVFAVVLVGVLALSQRQQAIDEVAAASARAVALAEAERDDADRSADEGVAVATPTERPAPGTDAGGPGTYTVQPGDSLFSVASELGLSPNELIHWNAETYPTLRSTPALRAGWVLRTAGPPLPTPIPRTARPPAAPPTPAPQVAGPGAPGPEAFPASFAVTVSYYAVSGSTPREISASIEENGPWSDWLEETAQASVETQTSFNFGFRDDASGGCRIVLGGRPPVTITYHVIIPTWTPPAGVSQRTVDWWTETIEETVAHEAQHITLYESYRPAMNEAVHTGSCASVEADLERIFTEARRANCQFDLDEYGYAAGMTLESCLAD